MRANLHKVQAGDEWSNILPKNLTSEEKATTTTLRHKNPQPEVWNGLLCLCESLQNLSIMMCCKAILEDFRVFHVITILCHVITLLCYVITTLCHVITILCLHSLNIVWFRTMAWTVSVFPVRQSLSWVVLGRSFGRRRLCCCLLRRVPQSV